MKINKAFITFLANDSFLPGILVLNLSLRENGNNNYPLEILVAELVSKKTIDLLKKALLKFRIVKEIENPYKFKNDIRNFRCTYTKLRIFELSCFEKIVYLDADMIVCENIENLFEKSHMSAVIAGAVMPENRSWQELNSGLLVIEPNNNLFKEMENLINELPSKDGSDQGFLHSFFNNWKFQSNLHLDHKYNIPNQYIDEYCKRYDFKFNYSNGNLIKKNIDIIHFWGSVKPWNQRKPSNFPGQLRRNQSISMWWDLFERAPHNSNISKSKH
jgi:lipopolysaccharide biosynthesis glycosyltransferase